MYEPAFPYEKTDPRSIESYAKRLVGSTLRQVLAQTVQDSQARGKGAFGLLLEQLYFGLPVSAESAPDFKAARVELKSFPLKRLSSGSLVPKERLVLAIINFDKVRDELWETSSFLQKNRNLLLVLYLWREGADPLDYVVKAAGLWEFPETDLAVIKTDWEHIVGKIREGRAHELSEGDTLYLGACTKGATAASSFRKQIGVVEPAKQRAFALKPSYMRIVVSQMLGEKLAVENIVKDPGEFSAGKTFEQLVGERFAPYIGQTAEHIAKAVGLPPARRGKDFYANITKKILGVGTDRAIAEFEKADVTVRTMRLRTSGRPKEDVSFETFRYTEIIDEDWGSSRLRELWSKRFFFVIYQFDREGRLRLRDTAFWAMPVADLDGEARRVWEKAVDSIAGGNADHLPKKSESHACHVRPHARNKKDTYPTPDGRQLVKKCFWLNGSYLQGQLGL